MSTNLRYVKNLRKNVSSFIHQKNFETNVCVIQNTLGHIFPFETRFPKIGPPHYLISGLNARAFASMINTLWIPFQIAPNGVSKTGIKIKMPYLHCRCSDAPAILNSSSPKSRATRTARMMLGGARIHANMRRACRSYKRGLIYCTFI